ncbi:MAG: glycoside hydrolase family 97 N-terminal domain-containing protein, partial [Candidatus Marinimicrobia bacterium]|nr:glycoside hydrolase family 97 N-terminal domain-containing protein [Candidatus Neomarinimicrobiota bacterium]
MRKLILIIILLASFCFTEEFKVVSPDQNILVTISVEKNIYYSVKKGKTTILHPSQIKMDISKGILGQNPKIINSAKVSNQNTIKPVVKQKSSAIDNDYRQLEIDFNNWSLIFRAYNDGVAYRFKTSFANDITVNSETIEYNFNQDRKIYFPEEESMYTHQEREYKHLKLSEIGEKFSSIPVLVDFENGTKVFISESDLYDYPGFYLTGKEKSNTSLKAIFPHYPLKTEQTSDRDVPVKKYADYLAITKGARNFPWRLMIITDNDKELIESQMVYKLAQPCKMKATDWINPGKVAWDWW